MSNSVKGLRIAVTAVLFGVLLSANPVSIGLVRAAHNFPHRAAISTQHDPFSAARPDRLALLIANSNYPDADAGLADVSTGVNTLAATLRNRGFFTVVVRDTTRAEMTEAVNRLKTAARPGSVVLVYFGGFAVQSEGRNYMIPVDANIWQERDVRRDGIEIKAALSDLSAAGVHARIAIIDASRRNPYERRFRSYSHGLAPLDAEANAIVVTSTSPEQVEDDTVASANHFVNDLAAKLGSSSRSVEEVLAARQAAPSSSRDEPEHSLPAVKSNGNS